MKYLLIILLILALSLIIMKPTFNKANDDNTGHYYRNLTGIETATVYYFSVVATNNCTWSGNNTWSDNFTSWSPSQSPKD